jgi:hypothetical protein
LKKLRDKTGITYHALERDLRNAGKDEIPVTTVAKERITETSLSADKQKKAVRFILSAKLFSASYAKDYDLSELSLDDETHIIIANCIIEQEKSGQRIRPSELFEVLEEDSEELNEILDFNYEDKLSGEVAEKFFHDSVKTLESERVEKEIALLNEEYAKTNDEQQRKIIAKKLAEQVQRRNKLKKR